MHLNRLVATGLIGALCVAACTPPSEKPAETTEVVPTAPAAGATTAAAPPIGYACESGQTVMVQYPDTATAQIAYRARTYTMRLVPSGSGARYSGSGLEWWVASRSGQESATLSRLGPNEDVGVAVLERCARPSANPGLPAPGPGEPATPASGGVLPASTPCRVAQLRLSNDAGDAGAGNRANVFGMTNTGTLACSVSGYPSVGLLDAQGRVLTAVRSDQVPAVATPVSIPANGKAFFDIAWNIVPNEGAGERVCPSVARVRVLIPGDTAALAVPLAFTPCGGRIRVNPFRSTAEASLTPPPAAASSTT